MAETWTERYSEREPLFACVYCGLTFLSPAGLDDGSDIICERCGSRPGEVKPAKENTNA